jgi:type I restriction enzyme S subunit
MVREYKDSGITWIGRIPQDWNTTKLGSLYTQRNEKVSDKDYAPLSVTMQGILPQLETAAKTDDGDNRKLVKKGDFAINSRSDRRGSCGISPYDGSVSLINTILKPRGEMNPNFYNWLFHTSPFADEFYKWGHGIVDDLWTTRWQEMKNISVVIPSLEEQQHIADYLDKKCAEIDGLIELQEQMIAQLTDYKQSVITEAVTKGLNPNVEFVPSGVDWIGDVPKGWKVCRIKDIFRLRTGTTPKDFETGLDSSELVNWFTPSDVAEMNCELNCSERHLSKAVVEKEGIELSPAGSLIFVGIGASAGKIGYATVQGYSNQQITTLIPKPSKCTGKYSYYYMIADRKRIRDNAFFTTLPIINNSYLSGIKTLLPSLEEQTSIASFLDKKCNEIDELITAKQKKIETLKEYKKSVIFEAVTGKIEIE